LGGAGEWPAPPFFGKETLVDSPVWRFVASFIDDEHGQDLVEYALLGAFVAIITAVGLRVIERVIGTQYGVWDTGEQNLWQPPNP